VRYLSPEWIDAVADAAARCEVDPAVRMTVDLVIADAPDGTVTYHVEIADGKVRVASGASGDPTIRLTQSYDTARSIATGELAAPVAFLSGALRLGGDARALIDSAAVFAALDDTLADLRAGTEY
jgi:hypothetical protein